MTRLITGFMLGVMILNFLNPVPWLFTLPIPVAVITVSGGLVARMLRQLDPVTVIERR